MGSFFPFWKNISKKSVPAVGLKTNIYWAVDFNIYPVNDGNFQKKIHA